MRPVLFATTLVTMLYAGCLYATGYQVSIGVRPRLLSVETFSLANAYAIPLLAILLAHEGGHWCIARWHGKRVLGPYFVPWFTPWLSIMTGTLGAFVLMREKFPSRAVEFDYAIAGPLCGFLVTVPVVLIGILLSHAPDAKTISSVTWMEPVLLRWIAPSLVYHPMLMAGWWGLILTWFNLLPIPPLDGWKIARAWTQDGVDLGRRRLALTGVAACLLLLSWPVGF